MADYYVLFFPLCKINLQLLLFRPLVNLRILRSITGVGGLTNLFTTFVRVICF